LENDYYVEATGITGLLRGSNYIDLPVHSFLCSVSLDNFLGCEMLWKLLPPPPPQRSSKKVVLAVLKIQFGQPCLRTFAVSTVVSGNNEAHNGPWSPDMIVPSGICGQKVLKGEY
jgi:hypothetical protein